MLPDTERLTRKEAAALLGVTAETLATWASTGRYSLRFFKAGKKVVYLKSDLDDFLSSRTQGVTEPVEVT